MQMWIVFISGDGGEYRERKNRNRDLVEKRDIQSVANIGGITGKDVSAISHEYVQITVMVP